MEIGSWIDIAEASARKCTRVPSSFAKRKEKRSIEKGKKTARCFSQVTHAILME